MGVVDERSEIGACFQGIPQNDVGLRTDILDCCPKAAGMMMLIRSMAPDVVAVDEIGGEPGFGAAALRDELRLPDSCNGTWNFNGGYPEQTGILQVSGGRYL